MLESLLIAIALAMDCFAVSVLSGVIIRRYEGRVMLSLAFFLGLFQALMPLIGWLLTNRFSTYIQTLDHWISFGLLAFIGGRMIADSFKDDVDKSVNPRNLRTQLILAVATSIDALAVGITYAFSGYNTMEQLTVPLVLIGVVSFGMSLAGFAIGVRFGDVVNKKMRPELLGGVILVGIGIKILIEHLSA